MTSLFSTTPKVLEKRKRETGNSIVTINNESSSLKYDDDAKQPIEKVTNDEREEVHLKRSFSELVIGCYVY